MIAQQPEPLLRGEREYRFSHDLLREVIYEQLAPDQRAAQHRRAAAWLIAQSGARTESYASLIAEHFERGGDRRQAGHWHARAGAQAQAAYAVDAAIWHYRHAITLLGDGPDELAEQLTCYEGLGFLQHEVAHLGQALITYQQMRDLAARLGDKRAESRALVRLSMVYDDASEPLKAYQHARSALTLAMETGDRHQIIFSMITLSPPEARLGSPQVGLDLAMRALILAREINHRSATGKALNSVGLAYEQLGNYAAATQSMREAVTIYRELGDLSEVAVQLNNMSYIAHNGGDFRASCDYADEGLKIAREIGSRVNEIYLMSNLSAALIGLRDYQQAEAVTRQGIHLSEINRMTVFPHFYGQLAEACLGLERVAEAVEAAQQGVDSARKAGDQRDLGNTWRMLGMAIAQLAEPQGALPCFTESVRLLNEAGSTIDQARSLRAWANYELRSGDRPRGRALMQQARAIFAQAALPYELAQTPELADSQ
jgi:tetratricopeptide (TPR) repeat protein